MPSDWWLIGGRLRIRCFLQNRPSGFQEIIFWMLIDSCVRLCRRNFVRERQSLIGFDFRWRGDKIGETRRRSSRDENAERQVAS